MARRSTVKYLSPKDAPKGAYEVQQMLAPENAQLRRATRDLLENPLPETIAPVETQAGLVQLYKSIIEDREMKAADRLTAIKGLRELLGLDRTPIEDVRRMSQEELARNFDEYVVPVLKLYSVEVA